MAANRRWLHQSSARSGCRCVRDVRVLERTAPVLRSDDLRRVSGKAALPSTGSAIGQTTAQNGGPEAQPPRSVLPYADAGTGFT